MNSELLRLEPIVAVVVGYFFGRAPSVVIERQLARRLEAAEALSEKRLLASLSEERLHRQLADLKNVLAGPDPPLAHPERVAAALRILG